MTVKELFDAYEYIVCTTPEEEHEFYVDAYGEGLAASSIIEHDFIENILDPDPAIYTQDDTSYPVSYTYDGAVFTTTNSKFDVSHSYCALKEQSERTTVILVEVTDLL